MFALVGIGVAIATSGCGGPGSTGESATAPLDKGIVQAAQVSLDLEAYGKALKASRVTTNQTAIARWKRALDAVPSNSSEIATLDKRARLATARVSSAYKTAASEMGPGPIKQNISQQAALYSELSAAIAAGTSASTARDASAVDASTSKVADLQSQLSNHAKELAEIPGVNDYYRKQFSARAP